MNKNKKESKAVNKLLHKVQSENCRKTRSQKSNISSAVSIASTVCSQDSTTKKKTKTLQKKSEKQAAKQVEQDDNYQSDDSLIETDFRKRQSKYPAIIHLFELIKEETTTNTFKCNTCVENEVVRNFKYLKKLFKFSRNII